MKKILLAASVAVAMTACVSTQKTTVIPKAVNTINSVSLNELNLSRADYEILNTITAEAVVTYEENRAGTSIKISGENDEFSLNYSYANETWKCKYKGILKFGYLSNDYAGKEVSIIQPEDVARRLAIYRIINVANEYGADGVIEPTISTNVEQKGDKIIFKSTVTAKIVKIKTNR